MCPICRTRAFYDVASHAKRPFVASHSDARAICPAVRNLTDDMICLLAEKGGVTGLNFCPSFLNAQKDYPGTAADVARHAAHIIKVGGEDCLGLGSDFDGIRTMQSSRAQTQCRFWRMRLQRQGLPPDSVIRSWEKMYCAYTGRCWDKALYSACRFSDGMLY